MKKYLLFLVLIALVVSSLVVAVPVAASALLIVEDPVSLPMSATDDPGMAGKVVYDELTTWASSHVENYGVESSYWKSWLWWNSDYATSGMSINDTFHAATGYKWKGLRIGDGGVVIYRLTKVSQ